MPVHQHVLNWLYSVLTSEYHDVNRTYNDVAQTLTRYPSLAPRTDVHTFPDGTNALLLHLSGTIPVNFRGSTYRFPLSVWVPHAYPRQPPLIYVTPTDTMRVRPGQHVDPQGQVYHPYLVGWAEFWDKSTLFDFLAILSDVFAKEPPVVSRQQPQPVQSPQPQQQAPPPVPPLPPQVSAQASGQSQNRPPPPPPKTHQGESGGTPASSLSPPPPQSPPAQRQPSRYDSAPPLPPPVQRQQPIGYSAQHNVGYQHSSPPQVLIYSPRSPPTGQQAPFHQQTARPQYPASPAPQGPPYTQWDQTKGHGRQSPGPWSPTAQHQKLAQPVQAAPPPPPPDLLDEPLTLDLPSQDVAPPPIPPNPEKDALLVQLAQTLASLRQQSRQQNDSSMAGLQAQRHAMLSVLPTIQSEMSQLTQLSNVLTSNATILRQATVNADSVIEGSRSHPAPDIDELLVAPTVVSNQLYALVAEERALGDAIFMLGRAVEKGRIPPAVFAKMTRSLAREWYLKKALVRKIGIGMGLTPS